MVKSHAKSARALAALMVAGILDGKGNLSDRLPDYQQQLGEKSDRAFLQALGYGVFRHYFRLNYIAVHLLEKPLKSRDRDIEALLLLGLLQLSVLRTPDHAAVSATVSACDELSKPWAKKLVNAILRRYQRESEHLLNNIDSDPPTRFECPQWLLDRFAAAYPDDWQAIAGAAHAPPPMTLRVNARLTSRDDYLDRLQEAGLEAEPLPFVGTALRLRQPVEVESLPGFTAGMVSVQDEAAQLAAPLLHPESGQRILDACAAPGGKLAHLLEQSGKSINIVGVEKHPQRFRHLQATLERLQLNATLKLADACDTETWWDRQSFNSILLDAPCTASGVIRRHPDIKVLRQPADREKVQSLQARLLTALWPLLKSGGKLLYVTCSLLPEENDQQIELLLSQHGNARMKMIDAPWGRTMKYGRQILPGQHGMDGFYYAFIEKI